MNVFLVNRAKPALVFFIVFSAAVCHGAPMVFSPGDIQSWTAKAFVAETNYRPHTLDGQACLMAEAQSSSSGYFREEPLVVDNELIMSWSWYGLERTKIQNEGVKNGDDFMARLYVVRRHWMPWRSQSLMYVWSHDKKTGEEWDSPYTGQVKIISVADAKTPLNQWHHFNRNISRDFALQFGKALDRVDAIAIMTDGDDAEISAGLCYGSIGIGRGE